jgi:hypothetical protein
MSQKNSLFNVHIDEVNALSKTNAAGWEHDFPGMVDGSARYPAITRNLGDSLFAVIMVAGKPFRWSKCRSYPR